MLRDLHENTNGIEKYRALYLAFEGTFKLLSEHQQGAMRSAALILPSWSPFCHQFNLGW